MASALSSPLILTFSQGESPRTLFFFSFASPTRPPPRSNTLILRFLRRSKKKKKTLWVGPHYRLFSSLSVCLGRPSHHICRVRGFDAHTPGGEVNMPAVISEHANSKDVSRSFSTICTLCPSLSLSTILALPGPNISQYFAKKNATMDKMFLFILWIYCMVRLLVFFSSAGCCYCCGGL